MDACLATALVMPEPDADTELVARATRGDTVAFEVLYRRHVARIHGALLRLAGHDTARAEDWTQEAFVRAWRKLGDFRGDSRFGTWLYRLAVNVALMALRAERSEPVDFVADDALPDAAGNDFCAAERAELQQAIAALPPRARTILVLHDVEGWRHADIACELGIQAGTSKAQLHRARNLLRHALNGGSRT